MAIWLAWCLNLPLLTLLIWWGWRAVGRPDWLRSGFGAALLLRLAGGIGLGLFYSRQFPENDQPGGDTFTLFRYGAKLTRWASHDFGGYLTHVLTATSPVGAPPLMYATYSNSFFFARLLSLLNFLTGSQYWLNALWLSVAAFAGAWLLARELTRMAPATHWGVLGGLLWPSVVFWTAGVTKDALLMASLGGFVAAALRLIYPPVAAVRPARWWGLLLLNGWFLWKMKFFIAVVVFVILGALVLAERLRGRWPQVRPGYLFLALALALAPLSRLLHRAFRPEYLRHHLLLNQADLLARSTGQPQLALPLEPSLWSFLRYAPVAAVGVFTRPWIWEGSGLLWRVTGLENACLLAFAGWAVVGWWRRGRLFGIPLLASSLGLFVLVIAVMFGLSTPNLGTLHRYRAVLLPFVLFLLDWLRVGAATPPSDNPDQSSRPSGYVPDSAGGAG
jgi:hypothetical protein